MLKQASEAANEQLQLLTKARDPRAFASAQADLVKRHGQLYVDQLKKSVDIIAGAWEEYGDQVEKSAGAVTDKAQSQRLPVSPRRSFVELAREATKLGHGLIFH